MQGSSKAMGTSIFGKKIGGILTFASSKLAQRIVAYEITII
jgi:hypothetical protein